MPSSSLPLTGGSAAGVGRAPSPTHGEFIKMPAQTGRRIAIAYPTFAVGRGLMQVWGVEGRVSELVAPAAVAWLLLSAPLPSPAFFPALLPLTLPTVLVDGP